MGNTEQQVLEAFEAFLETIPLEDYRHELLMVKTVEQDLPKELNPLPDIYKIYWTDCPKEFPSYEEFFITWWKEHLDPIDNFVKQYFWGCSYDFVRLGFKARLYRTLISILTQFHFNYTWRTYCQLPLEASAELDMRGIDAIVRCDKASAALQMKKETYRAEARGVGRFIQKKQEVKMVVELPYTVTKPQEWQRRVETSKSDRSKEQYQLFEWLATRLQRHLRNGFIVFDRRYPQLVEKYILEQANKLASEDTVNIAWDELLRSIKSIEDV